MMLTVIGFIGLSVTQLMRFYTKHVRNIALQSKFWTETSNRGQKLRKISMVFEEYF